MTEINTTQRFITADFLTPSYRIVGKLMVPNSGVMGMMNDPTNSFMEVLDAKLARLHMPTKLVSEYQVIDLVKANVFAICLTRREDMGPQASARSGYQKLVEYPLCLTTQTYELDGTLEWAGRFDFATVMTEGIRDFVPLYHATLNAISIPQLKIECPAVLFNRRQVDLLAQKTDKKKE